MNDVLTPALALEYLGELQPALTSAAVLDVGGAVVAGEAPAAGAARDVRAGGARVQASRGGLTVTAAAGPEVLVPVLRLDLESVLDALSGGAS